MWEKKLGPNRFFQIIINIIMICLHRLEWISRARQRGGVHQFVARVTATSRKVTIPRATKQRENVIAKRIIINYRVKKNVFLAIVMRLEVSEGVATRKQDSVDVVPV